MKGKNFQFDPDKINVETINTIMDALIKRMRNCEIDLNPDFQRSPDAWNDERKSKLIESMLIKIPLPAFYIDATDDDKWLVVDGLQRLHTVKSFVLEDKLKLRGLDFMLKYNGKRFSELPRDMQRRIEETRIVIHLIKRGTPEAVRYEIFSRINTGGTPLNYQEIRHAMNSGYFTDTLAKLAASEEFKSAVVKGVSSARMQDQECVLRFMAFIMFSPESYNAPHLDTFLQNVMEEGNRLSRSRVDELGKLFKFEAVSVNIGKLNDDQRKLLEDRRTIVEAKMRKLLKEDKEFLISVSEATGTSVRVRYRFAAIRDMLRKILNLPEPEAQYLFS